MTRLDDDVQMSEDGDPRIARPTRDVIALALAACDPHELGRHTFRLLRHRVRLLELDDPDTR